MKINTIFFALSGAITISISYILLALVLKYFPRPAFHLIANFYMIPKLEFIRHFTKITLPIVIKNVFGIILISFIFLWIFAKLYNIFQKLFTKS